MSIEKITSEDGLSQSENLIQENIEQLKKLFPEIVTEDKIDFKSLQQILGEEVEDEEEFYRFTWAGKSQARREAHKPSTGTLRPCKKESLDWDTTQNLYIEGDNLEVLKLLQKSYSGKIKMIYIDPPYNTGKDFVYKDNYKDNLKNYQEITGQVDSDGNKLSTNSDSDGRFHSNWLNMMYPRLRLARNLLKDDGVIFMSIDDNELENLIKIGNEIFGEVNFLGNFTWVKKKKGSHLSKTHRSMTEYIVVFGKDLSKLELFGEPAYSDKWQPIVKRTNSVKKLSFKSNIVETKLEDGFYDNKKYSNSTSSIEFLEPFVVENGLITTPLITKASYVWTQSKLDEEVELGTRVSLSTKFGFNVLRHNQEDKIKRPTTLLDHKSEIGTNEDAYKESIEIYKEEGIMDYPKPSSLMKYLVRSGTFFDKNSIVLDFFSGSGSTVHGFFLNQIENPSNNRYIMVQLPQELESNHKGRDLGMKTISDIGKERIRRVSNMIKVEKSEESKRIDLGFKVFKLDSSNIKSWDGNPENLESNLFDSVSNIKSDRTEEDVLYEILLKYGLDLTLPIEERNIQGKKVFSVGMGSLFICLSDDITSKVAEGIGEWKEECDPEVCRVIFKDNGFTDVEKTNSVQILKRFGINEIRSI